MTYVIQVEAPESVVWECTRSEPWRVSASWLLDLPQYNEWMTEEDYEVDANGKKKVTTGHALLVLLKEAVKQRLLSNRKPPAKHCGLLGNFPIHQRC